MVAGGQHVGKTALVWKITDSPILHGYISEFEDVYTTHMKVDSEVCKLQIVGTMSPCRPVLLLFVRDTRDEFATPSDNFHGILCT
jgi:hypothetical protein